MSVLIRFLLLQSTLIVVGLQYVSAVNSVPSKNGEINDEDFERRFTLLLEKRIDALVERVANIIQKRIETFVDDRCINAVDQRISGFESSVNNIIESFTGKVVQEEIGKMVGPESDRGTPYHGSMEEHGISVPDDEREISSKKSKSEAGRPQNLGSRITVSLRNVK